MEKEKGFRGFFATRPVSKTMFLLAIAIAALGFVVGFAGLFYAGYVVAFGAMIIALFFDG